MKNNLPSLKNIENEYNSKFILMATYYDSSDSHKLTVCTKLLLKDFCCTCKEVVIFGDRPYNCIVHSDHRVSRIPWGLLEKSTVYNSPSNLCIPWHLGDKDLYSHIFSLQGWPL